VQQDLHFMDGAIEKIQEYSKQEVASVRDLSTETSQEENPAMLLA